MDQFQNGMNVQIHKQQVNAAELLEAKQFDLEAYLPLELIREHTKTDDVPTVSDVQLTLYRRAALEAAQEYTGFMLFGQEVVTEDVTPPVFSQYNRHSHFKHTMQYPAAQPFVWYYGLKSQAPEKVSVQVGTRVAMLPRRYDNFGLGCCNPCGNGSATARIQYVSGFDTVASIPAAITFGALKYIAHVIENPGDNVVATSVSGGARSQGVGVDPAANPAWASGAIEIWRSVKKDAI